MKKIVYAWPWAIAIVALLLFAVFSFYGLLYMNDGQISKALTISLIMMAAAILFILLMSLSKQAKKKSIQKIGQLALGCLLLATLIYSSIPFSNYVRVLGSQSEMSNCITVTRKAAYNIDDHYSEYVNNRVHEYSNTLIQYVHNQSERVILAESLRFHLAPPSLKEITRKRHEWLDEMHGIGVWNIKLPYNLSYMQSVVSNWSEQYKNLSSIQFEHSNPKPFEYTDFDDSLNTLLTQFKKRGLSLFAFIVSLLVFGAMLLPYFLCESTIVPEGNIKSIDEQNNDSQEMRDVKLEDIE